MPKFFSALNDGITLWERESGGSLSSPLPKACSRPVGREWDEGQLVQYWVRVPLQPSWSSCCAQWAWHPLTPDAAATSSTVRHVLPPPADAGPLTVGNKHIPQWHGQSLHLALAKGKPSSALQFNCDSTDVPKWETKVCALLTWETKRNLKKLLFRLHFGQNGGGNPPF